MPAIRGASRRGDTGMDMKQDGHAREPSVFELKATFKDPLRRKLFGMTRRSLERFFLLDQVNKIYRMVAESAGDGDFLENAMRVMGLTCEAAPEDIARVPASGPLVCVANHPFGGIEGVVLQALLRRVRPDVKIMANYLLGRMPEMRDLCFLVNPFGTESSFRDNIRPMKESLRWLRDGHVLAVFPAGEVSHLSLPHGNIRDPAWSRTIAGIIRKTEAPVLPVFIEGRNSALFQVLGLLHPRLRTAMLPRELLNKRNTCLRFRIGNVVPFARLARYADDAEMMDYLRLRTYILVNRGDPPAVPWRRPRRAGRRRVVPVSGPLYPELLAEDVCLLPPESVLMETDEFAVHAARAPQLPHLLHEIGRLREITFRREGEGTGRAIDLDPFDQYYVHLIVWNRRKQELVGAYRVGKTDEILPRYGVRGLYTSTLFRYGRKLIDSMGPSLELGRSFVRPEYQRHYSALLHLWKGIGRMVTREPQYRHLFGPVSINNEYNTVSRQMLVAFLRANKFSVDWARYVRPRHPPRRPRTHHWDARIFERTITDPDDMSELIAEIEKDQKGVPILLKQYLKIGGQLLGFNVDPDFSDVLDGLIWVDLLEISPKILARFLGRAEAERFLAHHGRSFNAP
jgi:putative hemolysin